LSHQALASPASIAASAIAWPSCSPGAVARDAEAQAAARDRRRVGAPRLQLPARHPFPAGDRRRLERDL